MRIPPQQKPMNPEKWPWARQKTLKLLVTYSSETVQSRLWLSTACGSRGWAGKMSCPATRRHPTPLFSTGDLTGGLEERAGFYNHWKLTRTRPYQLCDLPEKNAVSRQDSFKTMCHGTFWRSAWMEWQWMRFDSYCSQTLLLLFGALSWLFT